MLFLEFLKDQFSDHCSSSFTLTVLLTCRSLLRQISHYADDILLYKPIRNRDDFTLMQTDLNNLSDWAARSCLSFNPIKCKFMVVTRKRNPEIPPVVTLGCHTITRVYQYTYLGVTLSADLSWDTCFVHQSKENVGSLI